MERFFQASKRQVPPFSVNSHPSVQNRSTLQLIYQERRTRGAYPLAWTKRTAKSHQRPFCPAQSVYSDGRPRLSCQHRHDHTSQANPSSPEDALPLQNETILSCLVACASGFPRKRACGASNGARACRSCFARCSSREEQVCYPRLEQRV